MHAGALHNSLRASIEETLEDLEFKLEKTSLPRPHELGILTMFQNME